MVQKLEPILELVQRRQALGQEQKLDLHLERRLAFPLVQEHMHLVVEVDYRMGQRELQELVLQTLVEVEVEQTLVGVVEQQTLVVVEGVQMQLALLEQHMGQRLELEQVRGLGLVLGLGLLGLACLDHLALQLPEKKQQRKVVGNMVNRMLQAKLLLEHYQMRCSMPMLK